VHVAATLRIAEHLSDGPAEIGALAKKSGAHADSLARVLRHLARQGLFEEGPPGRFALNEAARGLADPAAHLGLDLDGLGGRMAGAWGTLLRATRTGEPAYADAFGRGWWEDLEAHPAIEKAFDELMGPAGHGHPDPDVLLDGDWSSVRTVVDVGGGTGSLLAEILRAHPSVRGTLFDMPRTVARSAETFRAAGVEARASAVAGSFFDPIPAGADLYLLKSVLCDWPDREAQRILARCAEAASPSGRVVVVNGVEPDEQGSPSPNLLMLVLVGGKERSLAEFRPLAQAAGLGVEKAARQPSGRFLVECRPIARGGP
jgi:SAM-dependent methyltransferase